MMTGDHHRILEAAKGQAVVATMIPGMTSIHGTIRGSNSPNGGGETIIATTMMVTIGVPQGIVDQVQEGGRVTTITGTTSITMIVGIVLPDEIVPGEISEMEAAGEGVADEAEEGVVAVVVEEAAGEGVELATGVTIRRRRRVPST